MEPVAVVAILLVAGAVCALGVLTWVGSRKRGGHAPVAIGSALVFPLTWVVWYVRD